MSGNCVGLHPYGDCAPGVGCNRPAVRTPGDVFDLADRVHARLRAAHQECEPRQCALRAMWVEDVLEILEAIRAES